MLRKQDIHKESLPDRLETASRQDRAGIMFHRQANRTTWESAVRTLEVIYISTVKNLRSEHGSPIIGLLMTLITTLTLIAIFYFMFTLMGRDLTAKIRGDFVLFLMTGVFIFLTHNKAVGSVMGAEGPTSPMMLHEPVSTVTAIASSALATLYNQVFVMIVLLFIYHAAVTPITIEQPVYAFGMLLLGWFTGIAIGILLYSLKPWAPRLVGIISTVYRRANMIASGKMFVANTLPASMVAVFDWNPLFHCIDQARGFTFLNYNPHNTSISYPLYLGLALVMLGLIFEYYTRRMASLHWAKGR